MALAGCSTVPVTGRKQLMLFSRSYETRLGQQTYQETLSKAEVAANHPVNPILQRVGRRIAAVANRPDNRWEFTVIRSKEANAWALPGGKTAVYTGLLPICKNEAGLATVMSHEIGHSLARHGSERMSQAVLAGLGGAAVAAATKDASTRDRNLVLIGYGAGATVGVLLPYSRTHEIEADTIGLELMAKAGYDPEEAIHFWQRMAEESGGKEGLGLLRTHPSSKKRAENLRKSLPRSKRLYEQAPQQYGAGEELPLR